MNDAEIVETRPEGRERAFATAAAVTLLTTGVMAYAFDSNRAGEPAMLIAIGAFYAACAGIGIAVLHRRGALREQMRVAIGDISLGALTAGLLYGVAMLVHLTFTARGTPREGWIVRLYLQIGPGAAANALRAPDSGPMLGIAVGVIAALEEVVWRGLVQRELERPLGGPRALVATSLLCAVAHLSTLWLLRDPVAGLNPLLVAAAFGCSLVWGGVALRTRRLVPSILAHTLFSWAIVEFPIWRP